MLCRSVVVHQYNSRAVHTHGTQSRLSIDARILQYWRPNIAKTIDILYDHRNERQKIKLARCGHTCQNIDQAQLFMHRWYQRCRLLASLRTPAPTSRHELEPVTNVPSNTVQCQPIKNTFDPKLSIFRQFYIQWDKNLNNTLFPPSSSPLPMYCNTPCLLSDFFPLNWSRTSRGVDCRETLSIIDDLGP